MKRDDRRGAMPFAVIAVAILLGSAMCVVVAAQYEHASESTGGTEQDVDSIDIALENAEIYVNRGLGEIIRDISLDDDMVRMSEKTSAFDFYASTWLDLQFPLEDDGTVMRLVSHDITLGTESLSVTTELSASDGYVPTYLRATGTVTLETSTRTGTAEYDIPVKSDGSFTLPLADSQGSLFESMVADGGTALSQMMTYQLASVAQMRVINGYGAMALHGGKDTSGILTKQDVEDAYENTLEVLELICFRDTDGDLQSKNNVDLGDYAVFDQEGGIIIDVGAIYAQALDSLLDDIAMKWFDYFYGNVVIDALIDLLMPFKDAIDAIKSLVNGDAYSAVPLLKTMMELNGYEEEDYRYAIPGNLAQSVRTWDSAQGKYVYTKVTTDFPKIDIFELEWMKNFKKDYDEGDFIKNYIMDIIRSAGLKLGDRLDLKPMLYNVDPYDSERLVDTLRDAVSSLVEGGGRAISDSIYESLSEATIVDPIYLDLLQAMEDNRDSFTDHDALDANITASLRALFPENTVNQLLDGSMLTIAHLLYDKKMDSYVKMFTELSELPEASGSFIKDALSNVLAFILDQTFITDVIEDRMENMCNEMLDLSMMNSHGVVEELPGTDIFEMTDEEGKQIVERLESTVESHPTISVPFVVGDECIHQTGFTDISTAAYSTVFEISVKDRVTYKVEGYGAMSEALGSPSSVSGGVIDVDLTLHIPVVSGWGLQGVEYESSDTILTDAWKALLVILDPILEPLKKVMEVFKKLTAELYEHMTEIVRFTSKVVETLLGTVGDAIQEVWNWIVYKAESFAAKYLENFLVAIGLEKQSISMNYFGYTLTLATDAVSWTENTKHLLSAQISGPVGDLEFTAGINIKIRGEVEFENMFVTGFGSVKNESEDWGVKGTLDPLMKGGKHLLTLDGNMGDTDISLIMPEVVQYYELGLTLSDVPGLGKALSNIPLPVAGLEVGIDAGFQLRYSSPMEIGLLINEFESNPSGNDKGKEWVELYNNTTSTIDLTGYTLVASSDWRTKIMELSGDIAPGGYLVVEPEYVLVNESGKYTRSGEALTLKDPEGNKVDKTPTLKDDKDDSGTWHREFDGCTKWVFSEGTCGTSNGTPMQAVISASDLKDVAWDAVVDAFGEVGLITDMKTLEEFLEILVRNTIDGVIEKVTGKLVEASVFIEVEFSDILDTMSNGLRLALRTESQLPEDFLKYVVGEIESMLFHVENPSGIDLVESFHDEVDLELTVSCGMGFPGFLSPEKNLPNVKLGITFYTNLSAINELRGVDTGRPEMVFGVRVLDCIAEAIPGNLDFNEDMNRDLWLLKVTVGW